MNQIGGIKKIGLIIGAVLLLVLGFWGLYALLRSDSPQKSPNAQTPLKIELQIPESSLELSESSKVLEVSAIIEGNSQAVRVEYLLDGKVAARTIEPPFKVTINLEGLAPGKHTLQAIAYSTTGSTAKSSIFTFTIETDVVVPADDVSQNIVEESTQRGSRSGSGKRTDSGGANNSGQNSSGSSGNSGDSGNSGNPNPPQEGVRTAGGWWASLPVAMQVCSSNVWNNGPSSAPSGAIVVPAGDNVGFNFGQSGKTYWFAPGEHTLGTGQYSTITPGSNSTYIGAPGAVLDGKNNNQYAFSGTASNVRIAYLEIRNFGRGNDNNNEGVINHDSGTAWTMENLNAHHNDGAAVFIGTDNVVQNSCLKDNGQYGFSMYKDQINGDSAIKNITLHNNEISGNNQDDWEAQISGCGCTGAGKFWDVQGAKVTNNYVHDNLSTGLWADTNNMDFLFDSNWIEHNEGEGIWYEISYNATMSRNVLKRNAWTTGVNNQGSPGPAIYISESGGDSRLASTITGSTDLRIKNNLIEDNFSGISIYENANRFCNSRGNTSTSYCTPFINPTKITPVAGSYPDPISPTHPCYTNITSAPYLTDCRWHSKNVQVFNNEFRFTQNNVPCAGDFCGVQSLFVTGADNIPWDPNPQYNVANIQNNVMFNNNNRFYNNAYFGDWRFVKGGGDRVNWNIWQMAPYNQDNGSTIADQTPVTNFLDTNTATLEGSIGQWQDWFNTTPTRSTAEAHTGTHSLQVQLTGSSWGVGLANFPGFTATPGSKHVSFWAKRGSGTATALRLQVRWLDTNQQPILPNPTDLTLSGLSGSWQEASYDLVAPAGTATVNINFLGSGATGDILYIDDIVIGDN